MLSVRTKTLNYARKCIYGVSDQGVFNHVILNLIVNALMQSEV